MSGRFLPFLKSLMLTSTQAYRQGSSSGHDLDDAALNSYLAKVDRIQGVKFPVTTSKIGWGQSNPTFYVDDAKGKRFILRKKPTGKIISPVAHQVDREFRVLQALSSVEGFPVPKVFLLCMEPSVIGAPFYIMEFVQGRILKDLDLSELPPADRTQAWFSLIDTLAWLHSLDFESIGLEGFGKKTDFYLRQCNTYSRIEAQQAEVKDSKTGQALGRAHQDFYEVVNYVRRNLPGHRCSIVHGDFKFDNLVLHPTEPRIIAILDWELSTIGHPLVDLAFSTSPFWNEHYHIRLPVEYGRSPYRPENRLQSGMPSLDEVLDRYAEKANYDPRAENNGREWQVAKIFQHVRGATIAHGIKARTISGQASSSFSHLYFDHIQKSLDTASAEVLILKETEGAISRL